MASPNFTDLHYLAETAEWRTDRYYTYDTLTALLQGWVAAYPGLAALDSIGQTGAGREIWVVILTLPAFLAGERVIFVAAGSVDASVDFAGLGAGNVTVNADRTEASIALPAPVLGAARLDLERSYVADHRRGLRERLADAVDTQGGGTNTEQLYRIAQARLAEAGARTDELKARARTNTRAMLTSLLTSLGFREVTVTFADEK